jgi:hypothetical protein
MKGAQGTKHVGNVIVGYARCCYQVDVSWVLGGHRTVRQESVERCKRGEG